MEELSILEIYLQSAEIFYRDLPIVAQEIASWDMGKRWDYTDDEIPTIKGAMKDLKKWEPDMSAEQRVRFERLKELEAKCEPLIDKLLGF